MVQMNFFNGLINLLSNSAFASRPTFGFGTVLGNFFITIGFWIVRALITVFWVVIKFILNIVDLLQYFVKRLVGLDYWGTEKVATGSYADNDIIFRFIKNETVQRVFTYMLGIFAVLLIVFTIVAIVKSEYAYVASGADNSKKAIFGRAFKGIFMVIMVPIFLIVGIMASNAVLQGIVNAFALNNNITFGGQVFVGASYGANKYRNYANNGYRYPTSTNIVLYYDLAPSGSDQTATNISLTLDDGQSEFEVFDTTIPFVLPKDQGGNPITGYLFQGISNDDTAQYFWTTYKANDGLSQTRKNIVNALTEYYLKEVMGYSLVPYINFDNKGTADTADDVQEQLLCTNVDVRNADSGGSGIETKVLNGVYSSWKYNEYLSRVLDFGTSVTSVRTGFTSAYGTEYYSAVTYTNSVEWAKRYDGGVNGLVALPSEYKVMGDFMDFMIQNCIACSIVDITNSSIDWNAVINQNANAQKYYNFADNKINQFMVEYADEGYVVYNPEHGVESELKGANYIMCYQDYETGRYIPVLANTTQLIQMSTVNGTSAIKDSYKFTSDYLGENYCGFILARGGFVEEGTTWVTKPGHPTYISSFTTISGESGIISEIKLTEKYNVLSDYDYVEFSYEKVDGGSGLLPDTFTANEYIVIDVDGNYKWNSDIPLSVYDEVTTVTDGEGNSVDTFTKYGIKGEKTPLDNVFKTGSNVWTPTTYTSINEYGNVVFGFNTTVDEKVETMLLEYDQSSGIIRLIRCDEFYYTYCVDMNNDGDSVDAGETFYLFQDGSFHNFTETIGSGEDEVKVAIFNPYNMSLQSVESSGDVVLAASYMVEGYTYGSTYEAKLLLQPITSIDAVSGATVESKTEFRYELPTDASILKYDGFVYTIEYYNYYTSLIDGNVVQYNYTGDEFIYDVKPLETRRSMVLSKDITLIRSNGEGAAPNSIIITGNDYAKIFVNSNLNVPGVNITDKSKNKEIIRAILEDNQYYLYQDATYKVYSKISAYADGDRAKNFYKNAIVQVEFNSDRATPGGLKFDIYAHGGFMGIGKWHFYAAWVYNPTTSYTVERFEDGKFFMDYNFMDGAGPVMETVYSLGGMDFLILVFAAILLLKTLGTAVWGLIARIYEIVLYFLVMPGVASMYPLESGEKKFINWRDQLIQKVLSTYGVMIGLNAFFILLAPIREASKLFNAADMANMTSSIGRLLSGSAATLNQIVYLLFMLVAFTMIQSAPKIIGTLVGAKDEDLLKKGNDTRKSAMDNVNEVKKEFGDIMSGKKAIEAVKGVGNAISEQKGYLPGSAFYTHRDEKGKLKWGRKEKDKDEKADKNSETKQETKQETEEANKNNETKTENTTKIDTDDIKDAVVAATTNVPEESEEDKEKRRVEEEAAETKRYEQARKLLEAQGKSASEITDEDLDATVERMKNGGLTKWENKLLEATTKTESKVARVDSKGKGLGLFARMKAKREANENSKDGPLFRNRKNADAWDDAAIAHWNATHKDDQLNSNDKYVKEKMKKVRAEYSEKQKGLQEKAMKEYATKKFTAKNKVDTYKKYVDDESKDIKHYSRNKVFDFIAQKAVKTGGWIGDATKTIGRKIGGAAKATGKAMATPFVAFGRGAYKYVLSPTGSWIKKSGQWVGGKVGAAATWTANKFKNGRDRFLEAHYGNVLKRKEKALTRKINRENRKETRFKNREIKRAAKAINADLSRQNIDMQTEGRKPTFKEKKKINKLYNTLEKQKRKSTVDTKKTEEKIKKYQEKQEKIRSDKEAIKARQAETKRRRLERSKKKEEENK